MGHIYEYNEFKEFYESSKRPKHDNDRTDSVASKEVTFLVPQEEEKGQQEHLSMKAPVKSSIKKDFRPEVKDVFKIERKRPHNKRSAAPEVVQEQKPILKD